MLATLGLDTIKRTAMLLIAVMCLTCFVPRVEASFAPSSAPNPLKASDADRDQSMASIQTVLENKMVTQRLATLGYTKDEIDARLAKLSDGELHALATNLDSVAPGGELGVIIAVLVIILLVFLIIKVAR